LRSVIRESLATVAVPFTSPFAFDFSSTPILCARRFIRAQSFLSSPSCCGEYPAVIKQRWLKHTSEQQGDNLIQVGCSQGCLFGDKAPQDEQGALLSVRMNRQA